MRFVGVSVCKVVVVKIRGDLFSGSAQAQRHIGGCNALGGRQHIGLYTPVIHGKPFAGTPPSGHHLIGDEQHVVPVADGPQPWHIFRWRNEDAISPDNRLDDDGSDVLFVLDHVFEVIDTGNAALRIGMLDWAIVAIYFRSKKEVPSFAGRLNRPAPWIAGSGD